MSDYITATTTVDAVNHQLVFDTEGYYVVGDEEWQDISMTTTLTYNGGNIGISPRIYDTNMFLYMTLRNEATNATGTTHKGFASFDAQVTYRTLNLAQVEVPALVKGQDYVIKAEITGTNYRILLDGQTIFNLEYPGMVRGKVGAYATAGNFCKGIQVDSLFADAWITNTASSPNNVASIRELPNEDKYLYLKSVTAVSVYASQRRTVVGGVPHTLSFAYRGKGKARITELNGAAPKTFTYILSASEDWQRVGFKEVISTDCTNVNIILYAVNEELMVNAIQLEPKSFATGYIHNESTTLPQKREDSIITYPSRENIRPDMGSLAIWVNPSVSYDAATSFMPTLFEYGSTSPLRLSYESGKVLFRYGNGSVQVVCSLLEDTWHHIVATWDNQGISLYVDGVAAHKKGRFTVPGESPLIRIGHSADPARNLFFGAIDETIVLSSVLSEEEVEIAGTAIEPLANNSSMVMRATFNYAIGNFNKSIIEATLVPDYGSPVLVEKEDGTAMRKVSFFDYYTGEYRTFNEEVIEYDKKLNYIQLSYHDYDIDQQTFKMLVEDDEGVQYGEPLEIRGRKLYLSLTDAEKDALDGKLLYVSYQLEDAYTVDFNIGVPDSFRVTLGKHDGQPVRVTYEGNGFTDEKLLTMVEMNPLLNPNHEGFLYITRNDEKVTAFRVRATPEDLPANGGSESLVVVEPLDANGNYVSHCRLDVTADLGSIVPAYDEDSIKLRDRAGRFLYRYRSPILTLENAGAMEVQDAINVIDRDTEVGVQVPLTLTCLEERIHTLAKGDTLEKIAERYGSTIEDIAYVQSFMDQVRTKYGTDLTGSLVSVDRVISAARRYIREAAVGLKVKVPVNYSSRQLARNTTAIEHDKMIAYLTDRVLDYMNQPVKNLPAELGELLDFNADGMIDVREMVWLKENRLTTVLQDVHEAVRTWDNAN